MVSRSANFGSGNLRTSSSPQDPVSSGPHLRPVNSIGYEVYFFTGG